MRYVTEPSIRSKPVLWYLLIKEVEEFNAETGLGLGGVWRHIHNEHYEEAVEEFNAIKRQY